MDDEPPVGIGHEAQVARVAQALQRSAELRDATQALVERLRVSRGR